eukprot:2386229-Prymnesium_polylepis.1
MARARTCRSLNGALNGAERRTIQNGATKLTDASSLCAITCRCFITSREHFNPSRCPKVSFRTEFYPP